MLWSVLSDFQSWGAARTVTTLDDRIIDLIGWKKIKQFPADEVVRVHPGQSEKMFRLLISRSDAVLIIAPETDDVLARLTEIVECAGIPLLCSNSAAVRVASNKASCDQIFRQAGLPTPATRLTSFEEAGQAASELGYPLVIKPLDGTGCEGVCLATNSSEFDKAIALLRIVTKLDEFLLQAFIQGTHASVSLLAAEDGAVPLSLNKQEIETGLPFRYSGGLIPLEHPAAKRAYDLAIAAVMAVPGLRGYIGVDMILTQDQAWLIEINPRITTSYVGLHRILSQNLACAIWDACFKNVLPDPISLNGSVAFSKDNFELWSNESNLKVSNSGRQSD